MVGIENASEDSLLNDDELIQIGRNHIPPDHAAIGKIWLEM